MSFRIQEHIIPCQHIRQHDGPSSSARNPPSLAVKQYSPTNNPSPTTGDVTIIGAHGNGLVKELYEPLWEDLQQLLAERGRRIRSIWIADTSNQGASGLLNGDSRYDDMSWYDHSRDLNNLVNHFCHDMVQPIVAVGHSMGASQLSMLALGHPRLFSTLVLIDPIIAGNAIIGMGPGMTNMTLRRKTEWPSRQIAEKNFAMTFKSWDSRVLERFNKYALYPYPGSTIKEKDQPTRLITGRYQELGNIVRPAYIYDGNLNPDQMPWVEEALVMTDLLDFIPCSTFYICGALSPSTSPEIRKDWVERTGTGKHMGKPLSKRRVEAVVLPRVGHFVPMEAPTVCAEAVAKWIDKEIGNWEKEDQRLKDWRNLPAEKKEELAITWMANLKAKF